MKSFLTRTLVAVATFVIMSAVTLAGDIKEQVTFSKDLNVNGTLVKKGTYRVEFNEKTGEMVLSQGKKEVARATARLEDRQKKASRTEVIYSQNGETRNLQGIAFDGDSQTLVLSNNGAVSATPQQ